MKASKKNDRQIDVLIGSPFLYYKKKKNLEKNELRVLPTFEHSSKVLFSIDPGIAEANPAGPDRFLSFLGRKLIKCFEFKKGNCFFEKLELNRPNRLEPDWLDRLELDQPDRLEPDRPDRPEPEPDWTGLE